MKVNLMKQKKGEKKRTHNIELKDMDEFEFNEAEKGEKEKNPYIELEPMDDDDDDWNDVETGEEEENILFGGREQYGCGRGQKENLRKTLKSKMKAKKLKI